MEKSQLKKRLVGAIVLVAIAVIVIPMILSGEDNGGIWGTNIPDKPKVLETLAEKPLPTMPTAPPVPATTTVPVEQPTSTTNHVTTEAIPVVQATPTAPVTASPLPETHAQPAPTPVAAERAWVVQVGSFNQQANAIALRDKLRKKKYTAFVESVKTGQTTTYRVRVGPHVRRADAEAEAQSLAKQLNIKGVVLPHP